MSFINRLSGFNRRRIPHNWFIPTWRKRFKISSDHTLVDEAVTDVYFDLGNAPAEFKSDNPSTGEIRVADANGNELPREVVFWDGSNGELHFGGTGLGLSTSADTDYYIYWANSGASEPVSGEAGYAEDVWVNYGGVWHLQDVTGGAGSVLDSSGNGNHGTPGGSPSNTSGRLNGGGASFGGTEDYISFGNDSSLSADSMSYLVWVKSSSASNPEDNQGIIYKAPDSGPDREITLVFMTDGSVLGGIGDGVNTPFFKAEGSTDYYDENWHNLIIKKTFGSSGDSLEIFVDGTSHVAATSEFNAVQNSSDLETGRISPMSSPDRYFNGEIDEVRVIRAEVSSEWAATQHSCQNNNGAFWITGSAERQ